MADMPMGEQPQPKRLRINEAANTVEFTVDGGVTWTVVSATAATSSGSGGWRDYYAQYFRTKCGVSDPRTEKVMAWAFENGLNTDVTPANAGTGTATGSDTISASAPFRLLGPSAGNTGYAQVTNVNTKLLIGATGSERWGIATRFRLLTADANATFISGVYQGTDGFAAVGFFGTQFGALNLHVAGGLPGTTTPTATATLAYNTNSLYSVAVWSDGTNVYFEGYDGTTDTGAVLLSTTATAFPHPALGGYWLAVLQGVAAITTQPQAYVYDSMVYCAPTP